LVHIIHALTLDRTIEYKEVSFYSAYLPEDMSGYTIALITDTHAVPGEQLREIVQELNGRQIDLLLLGGDFPSAGGAERRTMEILSQVNTTDGIYGVEGNHDNYSMLFLAMSAYDIVPLSNSGVHIREGFFLAGLEDLWNRNPNIAAATADAQPEDFILLLAHNPDVTMRQDTTDIDLILSGHTHGGQITLFGVLAPGVHLVSRYGQRFLSGWSESRDGTPVYVSNGAGQYMPRVFARPQVILMTLYSEQ